MELISEVLVTFFLVIGGLFGLIGSYGLLKLKDTMQKLHAPTKATTLGVGGALIASMLFFLLFKDGLSFHEILIAVFLFMTAPVSAHFIAQTHIVMRRREEDLPPTEREHRWSVFENAPEDSVLPDTAPEKGE